MFTRDTAGPCSGVPRRRDRGHSTVSAWAVRPLSARHEACAVGALVVSACLVSLTACDTSAPPSRTAGPLAVGLEGVPTVPYGVRDCAAGALAEVLAYWGDPVPVDDLDARLPKARNGGVLSIDLLLEAGARGFNAELVEGSTAELADSIGRGEPAIIRAVPRHSLERL